MEIKIHKSRYWKSIFSIYSILFRTNQITPRLNKLNNDKRNEILRKNIANTSNKFKNQYLKGGKKYRYVRKKLLYSRI